MQNETVIPQPVVTLTQSAAEQVRSMLASHPESSGRCLRVYVEAGGCSGMQHSMTLDEKREGDVAVEFFGVPVVVDGVSAGYLQGATIDFSDALTGGGFKVTIPKAQSSCGCGKSFAA
ncbi:MAG: iron-sulfur cluster assembly protein [Verrucomicrobiota bacterium]|jgi:iron-sulfur cluster assembly protein/iron-sulfur cluster insertion protein